MQYQNSFQVYNASAGSGKTFTLVKEYLRVLLQSNDLSVFKKILAITFTNKAAGEMKERVLNNLMEFSKGDMENAMLSSLSRETGIPIASIQAKSKQILHKILQNYTAFHIKTIDSFTNKLIKSFAYELRLPVDFEVELDTDTILNETIDLVISKIGIEKELTDVLVEFAIQKTLEDRSWDISRDLREISKLLLKEDDAFELQKLGNKKISDFKKLEKKLKLRQRSIESELAAIGGKGLVVIDKLDIDSKNFYYSQFPNFFNNLSTSLDKINFRIDKGIGKSILNELFYTKGKSDEIKSKIDDLIPDLLIFYDQAKVLFQSYALNKLILKNLIPLAVINTIAKSLEEIKLENNILLISEFNQIISKHLREQPVAFIYEKLGEKYRNYFVDEMQDTSVMQWNNLVPLIDNVLSETNSSLLLVGDAKQAIYRWRGGRAEQFINLSGEDNSREGNPFQSVKRIENLQSNYRSYSEIIHFNNDFFSHISKYFNKEMYGDLYKLGNNQNTTDKEGGYVQLKFLDECKNMEERDVAFPEETYNIIANLEGRFNRNEICILVRKKNQGIKIANYLAEKNVEIVSSETLLLKNNSKVDFIIELLCYLKDENNGNAKLNVLYFLYQHLEVTADKHTFLEEYIHLEGDEFFVALTKLKVLYRPSDFIQNPFYESIENIIRSFRLSNVADAYLQFFLDFIFDYTQSKSHRNFEFLEYWELKKDTLSISMSENKNAVQIMTIHKSKGLEFPVVIYPYDLNIYYQKDPRTWYYFEDKEEYDHFDSFLVNSSSSIEETGTIGKTIFQEQQNEMELDNFNLLYVALTRAKEQLYILSENKKIPEQLKWYSNFFVDFLKFSGDFQEDKLIYEFGNIDRVSDRTPDNNKSEIQDLFISTSWKDHSFNVVSSSSVLWDTERGAAIKFGNLIHELMSKIYSVEDIDNVISRYFRIGMIREEDLVWIKDKVQKIVNHNELKQYFNSTNKILTERAVLGKNKEVLIPDRLVFSGENEVVIMDYKTGEKDKSHILQIENYAGVLTEMNFKVLDKILVYINEEITIVKI